ncbi:MAG: urease accessory protein UreF [Thermodesulfobacteriota bacterium]
MLLAESGIDVRILQLTDSSFPLGGFAFSYGLESMAKLGRIRDIEAFGQYLRNVMSQVSTADIPFVNSTHACHSSDYQILLPVFQRYDAATTVPPVRKASIAQGKSLLHVMRSVYAEHGFDEVSAWLETQQLNPHLAPVFGLVAGLLGLSRRDTASAYLYITLRDQAGAAVRLGLLGPQDAQRALREALNHINEVVERVIEMQYHEAYKVASILEIAQARHQSLYSRLFQN